MCLFKGVAVEWAEMLYSAREGDTITVCAQYQEDTEIEFTVNIATSTSSGMILVSTTIII